jgi:hypothetical protein
MKQMIYALMLTALLGSCSDFLDNQKPQGTLSDEQVKDPNYVDNLSSRPMPYGSRPRISTPPSRCGTSMYAVTTPTKAATHHDGDVFHQLEISQAY